MYKYALTCTSYIQCIVACNLCSMAAGGVGAGMRLSDIAEFIFTDPSADGRRKTIRWLQARSLLATQMTCSCGGVMNLIQRDLQRSTTQDDKWAWKCPECTSVRSIRSGSWFEGESVLSGIAVIYRAHRGGSRIF